MVTVSSHSPETFGERILALAGSALARLVTLGRAASNRRSIVKLLDWDDRMLRDIGLTRGDVRAVMALPMSDDPSDRLEALSSERRNAVRALARERVARTGRPARPRRGAIAET